MLTTGNPDLQVSGLLAARLGKSGDHVHPDRPAVFEVASLPQTPPDLGGALAANQGCRLAGNGQEGLGEQENRGTG